jgi:hypothetical protein
VYSRVDLSRTAAPVVAPLLTADSTGAVAREYRAANTKSEAPDRSNVAVALIGTCVPAMNVPACATPVPPHRTFRNSAWFETAMAETDATLPFGTAMARPIQRIRKVE